MSVDIKWVAQATCLCRPATSRTKREMMHNEKDGYGKVWHPIPGGW